MQSFDCTKYNRYGFTAQGQGCANVGTILCQFTEVIAKHSGCRGRIGCMAMKQLKNKITA